MKKDGFDYSKAEADLYDIGCRHPEDIYEYSRNKKSRDGFLKEHGLKPDRYYDKKASEPEKKDDDPCFLTTACVRAKGLPDRCRELETLRAYRDGYLRSRDGGTDDIRYYYSVAPRIVEKIDECSDADSIWLSIYDELVSPCVEMIESGMMEKTYALYKATTMKLAEEYLS